MKGMRKMTLPNNEQCVRVILALAHEPNLNDFEESFVQSNLGRLEFTDRQKEVVASLLKKYEI